MLLPQQSSLLSSINIHPINDVIILGLEENGQVLSLLLKFKNQAGSMLMSLKLDCTLLTPLNNFDKLCVKFTNPTNVFIFSHMKEMTIVSPMSIVSHLIFVEV